MGGMATSSRATLTNERGWVPALRAWHERGAHVSVHGHQLFVVDTPGAGGDARPPLVVLHGFPSSSFDWHLALPALARERRVVLFDLPGYGFSSKPDRYSYSLFEQLDVVEGLLAKLGVTRVHFVAHDMGTSVLCELLARAQRGLLRVEAQSVLFMNGSIYIELAKLTPGQKLLLSRAGSLFARASSYPVFRLQLERILSRPVHGDELLAMWQQLRFDDGHLRLPKIINYVRERELFWDRWIGALRSNTTIPAHVVWGDADPVAVLAIGERAAREIPGAKLELLRGVGHYPMLEAPDATAAAINGFLSSVDPQNP